MVDPLRGKGGLHGAHGDHQRQPRHLGRRACTRTASNTWGDGKQFVEGGSTTGANGQTAAVNAMWGLMNTYDMLKNTLGWQSLDGQNNATYIAVHVNTAYDNAYYSDTCKCMFIGDGSSFNSLGAIDVVGHEMGHGVTAATSNLLYFGRVGRPERVELRTSAAKWWKRMRAPAAPATRYRPRATTGMLGTEISKSGTPLRWMYKPSKDGSSPDAWSSSLKRHRRPLQQRPEQPHVLLPGAGIECRQGQRPLQQVPGQGAARR